MRGGGRLEKLRVEGRWSSAGDKHAGMSCHSQRVKVDDFTLGSLASPGSHHKKLTRPVTFSLSDVFVRLSAAPPFIFIKLRKIHDA